MKKKYKYNLYLLKADIISGEQALTTNAIAALADVKLASETELPDIHTFESSEMPQSSIDIQEWEMFSFHPKSKPPKWGYVFEDIADLPDELMNKTGGTLLFIKVSDRWFVLTFGASRYYIDNRHIEMDFGIRAIINMLHDDEVKYREGMNVANLTRDASQATFNTSFRALAEGDRVELVKAISGSMGMGNVSGSISLKFVSENTPSDLGLEIEAAYSLYRSSAYQSTAFAVIDQLMPVRDVALTELLDDTLISLLSARNTDLEIALPELIDHNKDISYVRFMGMGILDIPSFPDATITDYYNLLDQESLSLTVEEVKKHRIEARSSDGSFVNGGSIYKCILGTVDLHPNNSQERYVINEGKWYRVDQNFKQKIDNFFLQSRSTALDNEFSKPLCTSVVGAKKKTTTSGYEAELVYNTRIAKKHNFVLMDQNLIKVPGEPGRGFEICDLFDLSGKRLIHVKKSSRSSSVLSHFFSQGVEPLSYLLSDKNYFNDVCEELKKNSSGAVSSSNFSQSDLKNYTVHFVIADTKRHNGVFNIPFFSRITFYDRAKNLRSLVNNVTMSFIEL